MLSPFSLDLTGPAANLQTIIVISDSSALQTWRKTHFNIYNSTGTAANNSDANGNGLPDLMESLMGQNPVTFGVAGSGPSSDLLAREWFSQWRLTSVR